MTLRISTAGQHYRSLTALLNAQSQLAKTHEQVASGKRVITPSDDPIGATRMQDLGDGFGMIRSKLRQADHHLRKRIDIRHRRTTLRIEQRSTLEPVN